MDYPYLLKIHLSVTQNPDGDDYKNSLAEIAESAESFKEYPEWVNNVKAQRAQK